MTYSILGIDYSNGDVKTTTLHECDSSIEANSWVVGMFGMTELWEVGTQSM
jgi:hypothetical protein